MVCKTDEGRKQSRGRVGCSWERSEGEKGKETGGRWEGEVKS